MRSFSTGGNIRPNGFEEDTVNNPDGIDRTIVTTVNRDGGNVNAVSDWFNACRLGEISTASLRFIGLFIDTSGSMTLSTVQASYNKFVEDLNNTGLVFDEVFNGREEWIDPFLVDLAP